jgi:probable phosphoglycerate mutase
VTTVNAAYLVRHGQSEWNVLRLTQGQTEHPPLTVMGFEQARAAAATVVGDARSRGLPLTRVATSDLVRAVQTAEIVAGLAGVEAVEDKRLREQHLGDLEGHGYDETWAVAMELDWTDPTTRLPGGESVGELHARMADVIAEAESGTVLVSHGDAIRAALNHVDGHAPGAGPWVEVPNGAVFRVDAGGWGMVEPAPAW